MIRQGGQMTTLLWLFFLSRFIVGGTALEIPPPGAKTSLAASFKIQGAGVTPFSTNNQNLVVNAFAAVMTSVSRADITARYFTSDDSNVPVLSNSRRRLLQAPIDTLQSERPDQTHSRRLLGIFKDVVWLTLYINAGSPGRIANVENDLKSSLVEQGPYSAVPLQQALQSYGQPGWSIDLLSTGNVDPSQPLAFELACKDKFGAFCLDGSGLSSGAVKGIIAAGCILVVLIPAVLCVLIDLRRRSGRMGETPGIPDTPKTPMQKATHSITNFLKTSFAAIKPNTLSFTARHERPTVDQTLPRPRPGAPTADVQVINTEAASVKSSEKAEVVTTEKSEAGSTQVAPVIPTGSRRQSEVNTVTGNNQADHGRWTEKADVLPEGQ